MSSQAISRNINPRANGQQDGKMAYLLLLFYLFLLFFRPFDLITALKVLHLPLVAGTLCIVVYAATRFMSGRPIVPLSPITKVLLAMSIWVLITVPFAFWISGSLRAFWNDWMKMVILFLLLANVFRSASDVQKALWVCILGATGISIIAIALKVFLGESVSEGRLVSDASGLYSGPNFFSMTLILLLPFAIFFLFLHRSIFVRVLSAFIVAVFTVANMMTESRVGVLGEAFVVILAFWMLRKWGVSIIKTVAIVLVGGLLFLPLAPKGLWERFSGLFGSDGDATSVDRTSTAGSALGSKLQREELLVRAIILTAENPIFGVGMNNFPTASHDRFNSGPEDWLGCHDTFLQMSSELGIPGLLLYLALIYVSWKTVRSTKSRLSSEKSDIPEVPQLRLLNDAAMISLLGYVFFSTFAHLGYQPYFFIVAGFVQSLSNLSLRTAPVEAAAASLSPVTAS